ncbi:PIN domain nuclease [Catellatospora tritici]|uniref:PIN domain nuclease n=1 Tax=Catellatospora tritici TaxID=2851566 RepID=UPI001C2CEAF8|nr:PIN domain nuclease [Catellatospora tritici]MBV1849653.1 PIN domain nuclease [Catellatospora tritici]
MKPRYLVDTSALLRVKRNPEVARVIGPLLIQGSVAICAPALLEVMYSTRATEYDTTLLTFQQSMHVLALDQASCARAVEVQQLLAQTSQHRTAKAIDLLIAACAEMNSLTVLHYDRDYDAIAAVTHQPTMWVVPAGSVP